MASIARYDPFDLLEGMMKSVLRPGYEAGLARRRNGWNESLTIPIDVMENDTSYVIWADLPGVKKEDVNVSIQGSQVTLTAEFKQEKAVDQGQGKDALLWNERFTGTATRQMQLSVEIDEAKADARYTDGVLQLTLPKKESAQVHRIAIH